MVIRITDNCGQHCLHCMQESGPDKKNFMDMETYLKTLIFIKSTMTKVISISGGEPTRHPDILEYIHLAASTKRIVVLLSNGDWIFDNPRLRDDLFILLLKHKNLSIQITSVRGIYTNYHSKTSIHEALRVRHTYNKVKNQIVVVNKLELGYTTIGRAKTNIDKLDDKSFITDRKAPKCFNLYSIIQNFSWTKDTINLKEVVDIVKTQSTTSLCIPMVKENGDVVFGEYEACNTVWNVKNDSMDVKISDIVGPCGSCFYSKTQKEVCDQYLGVFKNKYNKLDSDRELK